MSLVLFDDKGRGGTSPKANTGRLNRKQKSSYQNNWQRARIKSNMKMARGHDCVAGMHFIYRHSQLIENDFFWIPPSLLVFPRIFMGNWLVILVHGDIIKKTFCNWGGSVWNLRGKDVDSPSGTPIFPAFLLETGCNRGWVSGNVVYILPFNFWPLSRTTSVFLRLSGRGGGGKFYLVNIFLVFLLAFLRYVRA